VGALWTVTLLGALSVGIFVLPVALLATWLLARRNPAWRPRAGLLTGAAPPLLYVAFRNRSGPRLVCTEAAGTVSCAQQSAPWPWLIAGLLFALAGVAVYVLASRHTSARRSQ
jgi:hypothetical protein